MNLLLMVGFIGRPFMNGLISNENSSKTQRSHCKCTLSYQVRFCTVLLRRKLTNECKQLASQAISHASIKHEHVQVHASDALPTRELKLASIKLENTCEYSQTNMRVLANELASTRKRTHEYSQSLASVTIFVDVSCNRINELWCTCRMAIRVMPWLHVGTRRRVVMLRRKGYSVLQISKNWCRKILPLVGKALLVT